MKPASLNFSDNRTNRPPVGNFSQQEFEKLVDKTKATLRMVTSYKLFYLKGFLFHTTENLSICTGQLGLLIHLLTCLFWKPMIIQ